MSDSPTSIWETSTSKNDFVETKHARINLVVQGPPRKAGEPVVVIFPGLGDTYSSWFAVVRRLGDEVRTVRYDRPGLGSSGVSELERTADNIAEETEELLKVAGIAPPYLLVGQSYGGLTTREFLARSKKGDIAGMILVDTNTHDYHERIGTKRKFNGIWKQINYREAVGFTKKQYLTPEELAAIADESGPNGESTSWKEWENLWKSSEILAQKKQYESRALSPAPLTVIRGDTARDLRRALAYAKERNIGEPEDVLNFEEAVENMNKLHHVIQKEQLQLSDNHRYVDPPDAGHNVQYWDPQCIADEIKLMLDHIKTGKKFI